MNTIKVYNPQELKDLFPDAFEKAHEKWKEIVTYDIPWSDEILDSMKAVFKAGGIRLQDYSLGAYSYCSVGFEMPYGGYECSDDIGNFTGQRAYNWIKANILQGARCKRVTFSKKLGKGWRYDIIKKDGTSWDCEFTGVCYDHDFIESLLDDIRGGCTLSDALHNLADVAGRLIESELEYMQSEEEFLIQDHLQFTDEGRLI